MPGQNGDASPIVGANGDMGENDTAALDPIFYFHHANIDRIFWLWQKKWGKTGTLDILPGYPGTNSSDNQGSTPGIPPNTWLDRGTPLNPYCRAQPMGCRRMRQLPNPPGCEVRILAHAALASNADAARKPARVEVR